MTKSVDEAGIRAALDACARIPIRSVSAVQSFGALMAIGPSDGIVAFVSENLAEICGLDAHQVIGQSAHEVLSSELRHAINNRASSKSFATRRTSIGNFRVGDRDCEIHAFARDGYHVLELEPFSERDATKSDDPAFGAFLMQSISGSTFLQPMLDDTVRMLRLYTGFDRVMVYTFDQDFNGEVLAEDRRSSAESYLGHRFPHWDIPPQARAIMLDMPLRVIGDTHNEEIAILQVDTRAPPLDLTLAHNRGIAPSHTEYLRNMGVRSSLTLSIVVEDRLWGLIAFHHDDHLHLSPRQRVLLEQFSVFFNTKMAAITNRETLALIDQIEAVKGAIYLEIEDDPDLEQAFDKIAPILLDAFEAVGVASLSGSQSLHAGQVPEQAVLSRLLSIGSNRPSEIVAIENLSKAYPDLFEGMNDLAGALVASTGRDRAIAVFRPERREEIRWAGNPAHEITGSGATARLHPRVWFSEYLEETRGNSAPWSEQDRQLARQIWPIIDATERRALLNTINRQQRLMIEELNHRVRNILALVRAVSQQTRRRSGSLNSYAESLESRIQALAAAHDMGDAKGLRAVSLREMILSETAPYLGADPMRATIQGSDYDLPPEIAPIFGLIIHELVTNAAKYGALSVERGRVKLTLAGGPEGLELAWCERGGPKVEEPEERGFGTVLIEQAIPHELGGRAQLFFDPEGVRAELFLPRRSVRESKPHRVPEPAPQHKAAIEVPPSPLSRWGTVLLLEDDFVIAKEMADQLRDLGFAEVEVCPGAHEAMEILGRVIPALAILDVNLGRGETSLSVAETLADAGVPIVFATGYGEEGVTAAQFQGTTTLTKPVAREDLTRAIQKTLGPIGLSAGD
ncbi:MAG: HWE histidine kinase domain-containing protein [Pseudomonadota bacterium]